MRRRHHSVLQVQRRLLKAVLGVVLYPRISLALCGLLLAVCIVLALTKLQKNTDQDQLFSPSVGFFQTYLTFEKKFPESEALYVLIEPLDKEHPPEISSWTAVADQLSAKLRLLNGYVDRVEAQVPLSELGNDALLFADRPQLEEAFRKAREELGPLAAVWAGGGHSPMQRFLLGMSLTTMDSQKAQFVSLLADSWANSINRGAASVPDLVSLEATDPGDLGYNYVADQSDPSRHLMLIQVYLTDNYHIDESVEVDAVRKVIAEVAPNFPAFHIATTGRPALDADETRTSDIDSTRAEIVALIVVFAGLVYFLRSVWLAAAAEISLAVSIGWTFGWATIAVGEMNLLSLVFLITLIGIGMDYLVQILTRYRREVVLYERPAAVWLRVFKHVSPPIFTACLGAAGAFFVSIFTDFRGASELGVIAGGGLLLCLAGGYTVLPALLTIFPPKLRRMKPEARYPQAPPAKSALVRLLPPVAWVVALAVIVPFAVNTHFNPNLLELQAKNLESVKLISKLQTWSAAVMSPDLAMLRKVRDAAAASPTVAKTDSVLDAEDNYAWLMQRQDQLPKINFVPPGEMTGGDLASIATAARILSARMDAEHFPEAGESLKRFVDALGTPAPAGVLSKWQLSFMQQLQGLMARFSPPPLQVQALPAELRDHLISADGTYALYIYPRENLWQRPPLEHFVMDVEGRIAPDKLPGAPPLTGIAHQVFHSTQFIEIAFYKSTAYALALVLILVFLDLRSVGQTLLTVSVLGLGLPMLIGLMGLLKINWNFANFFGLPILIGAGHEYGVFMMHRYREAMHDPRRVWTSWDVSDRALLLCAFVTTSSFAFFWGLGHHEGLKSLGLVMALGIGCIYLAALLVVRPVLKWKIERQMKRIR